MPALCARRPAAPVLRALGCAAAALTWLLAPPTAEATPEACDFISVDVGGGLIFEEWRCQLLIDAVFDESLLLEDGIEAIIGAPPRSDDPLTIGHTAEILVTNIDEYLAILRGGYWLLFDDFFGILTGPRLLESGGAVVDPETNTITFSFADDVDDPQNPVDFPSTASMVYEYRKISDDVSDGFVLRQTYTIRNDSDQGRDLILYNAHWAELDNGFDGAYGEDGVIVQLGPSTLRQVISVTNVVSESKEPDTFRFDLDEREYVSATGTCGQYEEIIGAPCGMSQGQIGGVPVILNFPEGGITEEWPADDPNSWVGVGPPGLPGNLLGTPLNTFYSWDFFLEPDETFSVTVESFVYRPEETLKPYPPNLEPHVRAALDTYAEFLPEPGAGMLQAFALVALTGLARRRA